MRTAELLVPRLSAEEWKSNRDRYVPSPVEAGLMQMAADAGRRGYLTFDEFLGIARWKSPRPTKRYRMNTDTGVQAVTAAAFSSTSDVDKLVQLTNLIGINVRAATAILHLCFPNQYPLLDVRAMAALGHDKASEWHELQWLRTWTPYTALCRQLASELEFDLRGVDRALFEIGGRRLASGEKVAED